MKKILCSLLAGLLLGAAATWLIVSHRPADQPADKSTDLDISTGSAAIAKKLAAAGLAFAAPEPAQLRPEVQGYGRVLDSAPLIALAAEIQVARVAADASTREFERVKSLHDRNENASQQAVETADAARQRDRVQLAAVQARLPAGWGRAIARRPDFNELIPALAAGEAVVVRIDLLPGDAPAEPAVAAHVGPLTGTGELSEVELLGPAPAADPQGQGLGYLALWRAAPLPPGAALRATVTAAGAPEKVLVLPRSAFVRHAGAVFVYVKTSTGGFERRLVALGRALPAGLAVTDGVGEKDQVVVTGAQQLLATELLGSAGGEGGD